MPSPILHSYRTRGGIAVQRTTESLPVDGAIRPLTAALDTRRGVLLSSGYDYPGRYTRWDLGFVDPPLALTARDRTVRIDALNGRGRVLLPAIAETVRTLDAVAEYTTDTVGLSLGVRETTKCFAEEQRSRQPSVFSILRALGDLFGSAGDRYLGLYGAFGYDLAFQFEPIRRHLPRPDDQRDLVLYLPDEILAIDHMAGTAIRCRYDFTTTAGTTAGMPRDGGHHPYRPVTNAAPAADHAAGEYAAAVETARAAFHRGDLFEAVLSQTFAEPCAEAPSEIFHRLKLANPAPYGALINLGEGEFLVAASPEMYVRVEGRRIETCPISGTIARGRDAIGDAGQILTLLNSAKDAAELTMCTDVDRNDKSRICEPGSVRVIGRRQIELYSRLIHTVDHVEGILRPDFDALDAFLSHTWAVTVTGAPKRRAMQFVEDTERSSRRWYGGAIGAMTFDGGLNTGLTLRTIRMRDGVAEIRVGATLLHDSDPEAENAECRLKAAALFAAIAPSSSDGARPACAAGAAAPQTPGLGRRILLVDHEDSFVHTLANYFRQTGAAVTTLRPTLARAAMAENRPDLIVLSPGPGRPADFGMADTLKLAAGLGIPVFGVCLGLQGIVEALGGDLDVLEVPMHGKPSAIAVRGGRLFRGLPERLTVGRYHSLHARRASLPAELRVTAETDDGVIMAIEHIDRPIAAVQFHPESILSLENDWGLTIITNALEQIADGPKVR